MDGAIAKVMFAVGIMAIPGFYLFGFERLLREKPWSRIVDAITSLLLVPVIVLGVSSERHLLVLNAVSSLACPLYQVWLYRILWNVFVRMVGREPVDVFLNWTPGLAADRTFAIFHWVFSLFSSVALAVIIVPWLFGIK